MTRLKDFPAVLLSYDEPWADRNWRALKEVLPQAVRVHGVKGLDACHKAAADAVPGDWVVTIDADTRISPALAEAEVPPALLNGNFRLDWLSLNPATGLWSGNGCVKLWPKALIREMRTHEAAPEGELSLDHDISAIRSGRSGQMLMPDRAAVTDPAETAFHAFRAGLREMVFLRSLGGAAAARTGQAHWMADPFIGRLIHVWCSVGRHALNGRWLLYGARLGLALPDIWPDWDLRQTNDHDALHELWQSRVVPRFGRGASLTGQDPAWNWDRLEADLRVLARGIAERGGPVLAEFEAGASQLLAAAGVVNGPLAVGRLDSLGYRLMQAARTPEALAEAGAVLERAAFMGHASAHDNLGRLALRGAAPDPVRAARHFRAAIRLGNRHAAGHLEALVADHPAVASAVSPSDAPLAAADLPLVEGGGPRVRLTAALKAVAAPLCLLLDPGASLDPVAAAGHLPDLERAGAGLVTGYFCRSAVTGLPRPHGLRLGTPQRLLSAPEAPADVVLPIVLGYLPAPKDPRAALSAGLADGGADIPSELLTLGRDVEFGGHWVLGLLLAQLGEAPSPVGLRRLADLSGTALDAEIAARARAVADGRGGPVPLWSGAESLTLKATVAKAPSLACWHAAARALAEQGHPAQAALLQDTAMSLWGLSPALA